ncbi:DUF2062 domain-containing protein [Tepidimonas sp.]|uniref:DUF2062 domain-containing protein n=1 Tax=Tepidimonas sp. TaxID=2002775 RepID=UPI0028CD0078|nr:DUF2062 domain-containing protein [Tepidimonas sp.]MDT7928421.1 DUF2062 domain-containing protein [Tepidimonas sp.]
MKDLVLSLLPSRERLQGMRWLRWLSPYLHHPRLWHLNRKGLALGLALGVFFGLLIPLGQIPASATLAVLLRANLPAAVASTFVTNPVTIGPVYYGAFKLGAWVLQSEPGPGVTTGPEGIILATPGASMESTVDDGAHRPWWAWAADLWHWISGIGKPLAVGLAIVASVSGIVVYVLVNVLWVWKVRLTRRRRLRRREMAAK